MVRSEAVQIFTIFYLIATHTPISAQSSNSIVFRLQPVHLFLLYKGICYGYPFELHRLVNAIQMRIYNIPGMFL